MTVVDQRLSGVERMVMLCDSFPALRGRAGTNPFEHEAFARAFSGGQSSAEKQAAAFVLAVWNGCQPADGGWWNQAPYRVGRFDAVDALALWDREHCAAFVAWCQNPFWP